MENNLPPTTPTNPISQPPVEPVKPSNSKVLLTSLIALEVITLAVAGYFGYQFMQLKKQISNSVEPTPLISSSPISVLPTSTPSEKAGWKTYTNNTYNYSIGVPTYITQLQRGPANQTTVDDADWLFAKTDMSLVDSAHKTISSDAAIALEIASYKDAAQQNYDLHCKGDMLSFNQEKPTISYTSPIKGVDQYVQSYGLASHYTVPQVKYWDSKVCFVKNGVDYEIYYQNYESSNTDPTLGQILSTFNFTQ